MTKNQPVVVGVDGSEPALRAVRWAAEEAGRQGVPLRLVYASELPFGFPPGVVTEHSIRDMMREQGDRWLEDARAAATAVAPDVRVDPVTVDGAPVEVLVRESRTASLVAVGTRGHGGFTGLLLGSTSVGLAGRSHCPMVVVRGEGVSDGSVVVGVDGTPTGEAAIEFAFAEASARSVSLVAVHCWTDPAVANALAAGALAGDYGLLEDQANRVLAERLAGWQEKYPDVPIIREVVREHPTRALLHFADHAQLVVVGSRGRGGFTGLLLGSTSQYLTHHVPCPVAVVRTDHS